MAQDTLLHEKTLVVISTTDSGHITFLLFTQNIRSYLCGRMFLIGSLKLGFIIHFNDFLTSSGWVGDIQFHLNSQQPRRLHNRRAGT